MFDPTPPTITASVGGMEGQHGWYKSNVTVNWTVSEPKSPASLATSDCEPTTITRETTGVTPTCSTTSAGGANDASVTIKTRHDRTHRD